MLKTIKIMLNNQKIMLKTKAAITMGVYAVSDVLEYKLILRLHYSTKVYNFKHNYH